MIVSKVLFEVEGEGEEMSIVDVDMTPTQREILQLVQSLGYDLSVFFAYMAEMYPFYDSAPLWRGLSGTRNGVNVCVFLGSIPEDIAWIDLVNKRFKGRMSVIDKVFIAWLKGEITFKDFNRWGFFFNAAQAGLKKKDLKA
jgi:hypothetical protein